MRSPPATSRFRWALGRKSETPVLAQLSTIASLTHEAALLGLSSCVSEAIVLNCARTGVKLDGLDVKAHADIDPGPITGAKDPSDWDNTLKQITVDVTTHGDFTGDERKTIEDGAKRSPVRYMFSKTGLLKTNFHYE